MSFWYYCLDKIPTRLFLDFCLDFFYSFLGASWKLFHLPGDLVCNFINKEAYRKPQKASRKPHLSFRKFHGRNPYNILVAILIETMTPKGHFEINWPLGLTPFLSVLKNWAFLDQVYFKHKNKVVRNLIFFL